MQADCKSAKGHHNTEQLIKWVINSVPQKQCIWEKTHYLYVHRVYTFPGMDSKWTITVQKEDCGGIVSISMKTSA